MKTRLEWIDIAKCLAIILVVLGHATGASIVGKYIYSFHMPLFFIISGMCFTNGKYKIKNLVKKRFKQLFLPAIWLTFISVIIIKLANHPYELSALGDALPGALWFLPVLFFVEVIYCLFSNCSLLIRGGVFNMLYDIRNCFFENRPTPTLFASEYSCCYSILWHRKYNVFSENL